MDSEEEFKHIDFSCPDEVVIKPSLESTDHSELECEKASQIINDEGDSFFEKSILTNESTENLFFSSVADFEKEDNIFVKEDNIFVKEEMDLLQNCLSIEQTSSFSKNIKRMKLLNDTEEIENQVKTDLCTFEKQNPICNSQSSSKLDLSLEDKSKDIVMTPEVGFKTGNNKKIKVNIEILNRAPKFSPAFRKGPMRSYNCPEKGHISSEIEERNRYMFYFEQLRKEFKKTELSLLKIQFRWTWINLFLNKQLDITAEASKLLIEGVRSRLNSEYSIIRRIVEGDDVSYRYMILLVLSYSKNVLEVFDGYFSCKIQVDNLLSKLFESKKVSLGFKIKLFGCKFVLSTNKSILDYNNEDIVMLAFYNAFDFALPNRVLGYRKKISFVKNIKDIRKEGGIVSCIKGTVKRIIDSRYVVQVKGYRNSVENLEAELENIQNLIEKTKEEISNEDVKIKKYVRFILEDSSGECLITSWMYTEEIRKDAKVMFCGLKPVESALGLHLTTNKLTYIKFYS